MVLNFNCNENCIEWITGDKTVTCTFSQKKFINRIRRMSETHGDCVKILAENPDGSIMAKIPLRAVHLTIYESNTTGFAKVQKETDDAQEE